MLAQALRWTVRPLLRRIPLTPQRLSSLRGITGKLGARYASVPDGTVVRSVALPQCSAELICAAGVSEGSQAILYAHGGGFVLGSSRIWRSHLARLSALSGFPVLSVDYRLAPGHHVSESVEDCVAGYQWLLEQGYEGRNIVLGGDSAGANLAFGTALRARRDGLPRAAAVAAMSPWVDLAASGLSYRTNRARDPYMAVEAAAGVAALCARGMQLDDPALSPVYADLSDLPPTLIQVGSLELLRSDSELMAERLTQAGVVCEVHLWQGQMHSFVLLAGIVPDALAALHEVASFAVRSTARDA